MSFLTWIGSKRRLLPQINQIIEQYLANESGDDTVYVELFLSSGSVLINVLEKHLTRFKRYICCDANDVLIKTFNQIKTNHQNLIITLECIQNHYQSLDMKQQKEFFYKARDLFNDIRLNKPINKDELDQIISSDDHDLILVVLFIFLN